MWAYICRSHHAWSRKDCSGVVRWGQTGAAPVQVHVRADVELREWCGAVVSEGFQCGWKSSPMWCAGTRGWPCHHAMELEVPGCSKCMAAGIECKGWRSPQGHCWGWEQEGLMGSLVSLFHLPVKERHRKGNTSPEPAGSNPALPHQLFLLLKVIEN